MPLKVDRSADMSVETFNALFMKYYPLVYKVVIKYTLGVPLHDTPMFSSKEDIVNYCYLEMRRLGTFSRFDAERAGGDDEAAWLTYVGEQVLSILRHSWQDHCRLNTRKAVSVESTFGHETGSSIGEQSATLNSCNWDPNLEWTLDSDPVDQQAEYDSVHDLLVSEAAIAQLPDVSDLVQAMRRVPELACAPTAKAVAAVLGISVLQASRAIKNLRELATALRLA